MPALNNRVRETCVAFLVGVGLLSELVWILAEIEAATGWEEARRQCFAKMQSRTGEVLLAWGAPARELLVAQQVITTILWTSPLAGRRDALGRREAEGIALLAALRGRPTLTLVDPERLRRRDPDFLDRCTAALTALGVGGAWKVCPTEDPRVIRVSHVFIAGGCEITEGIAVQTTPFRFPAP